MASQSNRQTNRLALDALIRQTPQNSKIPLPVLEEPALLQILKIPPGPVYENLASLALENFRASPTGRQAREKIQETVRYSSKSKDPQFVLSSVAGLLKAIESIGYAGDREDAASIAAYSIIRESSGLNQDIKKDVLETLNELLIHSFPGVRNNMIAILSSCAHTEMSREEAESAFMLTTPSKEETGELIGKADHCCVTDFAVQRLYHLESAEEAKKLAQFESAMDGKIVSGAQILDAGRGPLGIRGPGSRFYDPEEFMHEAWRNEFLKTMQGDPSSEKAKQMLWRIRNDSIGDEISEKRVCSAIRLLSKALGQTSTVGARKAIITLCAILKQVSGQEFYQQLKKEHIEPLVKRNKNIISELLKTLENKPIFSTLLAISSDQLSEENFEAIMDARKSNPNIESGVHSFTHHIRFPVHANALVCFEKNGDSFSAKALGYLAVEVVSEDLALIEKAMEYYEKKMGRNISQVFDHEEKGIYRFFFFKCFSPEDAAAYTDSFSKSVKKEGVEDAFLSFRSGFTKHACSTEKELVGAINRLALMEKGIQEENFLKIISESPETDLAKETVARLIHQAKSEKTEESAHRALLLLCNAMRGTNEFGKIMLAIAVSEIYEAAPEKSKELLFGTIEPLLGENITGHCDFLSNLFEFGGTEAYSSVYPLIENYLGTEDKEKLDAMVLRKELQGALALFMNDPADPEASLHLQDAVELLAHPALYRQKEHINATASLLDMLQKTKDQKKHDIAASKVSPALVGLACALPAKESEEAISFAGKWLPLNSHTARRYLVRMLESTGPEHDEGAINALFGLSRPSKEELAEIKEKTRSTPVRKTASLMLENQSDRRDPRSKLRGMPHSVATSQIGPSYCSSNEQWIPCSERRTSGPQAAGHQTQFGNENKGGAKPAVPSICSGSIVNAVSGELETSREKSEEERFEDFAGAMDMLFASRGIKPIPPLAEVLDHADELRARHAPDRPGSEYDHAAILLHFTYMNLDQKSRKKATSMYNQSSTRNEDEFESETTKPEIPLPYASEAYERVHNISKGQSAALSSLASLISALADKDISGQLEQIQLSFALLGKEEGNIAMHSIDGIASALGQVAPEQRMNAIPNAAKAMLAICESLKPELYHDVAEGAREKISRIPGIPENLLQLLMEPDFDESGKRKAEILFSLANPDMGQTAMLADSSQSFAVRSHAHGAYYKEWKKHFVMIFEDNPGSEQAQNALNVLMQCLPNCSMDRAGFAASVFSEAIEAASGIGPEKLLHAAATAYSMLDDHSFRVRFKQGISQALVSKKPLVEKILRSTHDQKTFGLLFMVSGDIFSEDEKSDIVRSRKKEEKEKTLKELAVPDTFFAASGNIENSLQAVADRIHGQNAEPAREQDHGQLYAELSEALNAFRSGAHSNEGLAGIKRAAGILSRLSSNRQLLLVSATTLFEAIASEQDPARKHEAEKNVAKGMLILLSAVDQDSKDALSAQFRKAVMHFPSLRAKISSILFYSECAPDLPNPNIISFLHIANLDADELGYLCKTAKSSYIREQALALLKAKPAVQAKEQYGIQLNKTELATIKYVLSRLGAEHEENGMAEAFVSLEPGARDFILECAASKQFCSPKWKHQAKLLDKTIESICQKLGMQKATPEEKRKAIMDNPGLLTESQKRAVLLIVGKANDSLPTRADLEFSINWVSQMGPGGLRELLYQAYDFTRIARLIATSRKQNGNFALNPEDHAMLSLIFGEEATKEGLAGFVKTMKDKSPASLWVFDELQKYGMDASMDTIRHFAMTCRQAISLFDSLGIGVNNVKSASPASGAFASGPSSKNRMGDCGFSYAVSYHGGKQIEAHAVFDGISGHTEPDFASKTAAEIFELGLFSGMVDSIKHAAIFCEIADLSITMHNLKSGVRDLRAGSGTTISMAIVSGNTLRALNAGDSSIRVYRRGKTVYASTSHSLFSDVAKDALRNIGLGQPEKAMESLSLLVGEEDAEKIIGFIQLQAPAYQELYDYIYWNCRPLHFNRLDSALGISMARLDVSGQIELEDGDVVALYTDGISDTVCPHNLASATRLANLSEAAQLIMESASNQKKDSSEHYSCGCLKKGKDDDKYIILARHGEAMPGSQRGGTLPLGLVLERTKND